MQVDICLNRSQSAQDYLANFKVEFPTGILGLQFWIVAEVCYLFTICRMSTQVKSQAHDCQFSALVAQIKGMMEDLNRFQSILHRLGLERDAVGMMMELGKPLSEVNHYQSMRVPAV